MAEARRLKTGRWRIYRNSELSLVRDPSTGKIATFDDLSAARRWWATVNPREPSLQEAHKCAKCGAYFGANSPWTVVDGRPYHLGHAPK